MLQRGGGGRTCEGCPTSEVQHHARRAALDHGKAGTTDTQKGDRAMTIAEVQAKARELKKLKRMREELDGEMRRTGLKRNTFYRRVKELGL